MLFKMIQAAQKSWRKLDGQNQLPKSSKGSSSSTAPKHAPIMPLPDQMPSQTFPHTSVDGDLDVYLGHPIHPLPSLIFSRSMPTWLGDMATALLLWFTVGQQSLTDLPLLILLATASAIVFVATNAIVQSAAFWFPGMVQLAEEILSLMILVCAYPQHTFGIGLKIILYSVLPTAFIGLLPVETIREGSVLKACCLFAAATVYVGLAYLGL